MATREYTVRKEFDLDQPISKLDIPKFLNQIKTEIPWKTMRRNAMTLVKTEGLSVVLLAMQKGVEMEEHRTEVPFGLYVVDGAVSFEANRKPTAVKKGEMIVCQPGIYHSVTALEDSACLLVLSGWFSIAPGHSG